MKIHLELEFHKRKQKSHSLFFFFLFSLWKKSMTNPSPIWKKKFMTPKETTKTQTQQAIKAETTQSKRSTMNLAVNLVGKPTNPSLNWTHKRVWFLRRRSFSLYSLSFICAVQELKFHWKSFPTDSEFHWKPLPTYSSC